LIKKEDMFNEENSEDQEILKSIAYAEKQLGHKLGTPSPVRQSGSLLPVTFDDESVNTKIDSSIINCMIQSGNKNDDCTK
jgi:hypothetical protein